MPVGVAQLRVTSAKAPAAVMGSALTLIVISIKVSSTFSIQLFCHYTLHEGSQVKSVSCSLNECRPYK